MLQSGWLDWSSEKFDALGSDIVLLDLRHLQKRRRKPERMKSEVFVVTNQLFQTAEDNWRPGPDLASTRNTAEVGLGEVRNKEPLNPLQDRHEQLEQ